MSAGPPAGAGPQTFSTRIRHPFAAQSAMHPFADLSLPYVFFVFVHSFLPCADLKKGHVGAAASVMAAWG